MQLCKTDYCKETMNALICLNMVKNHFRYTYQSLSNKHITHVKQHIQLLDPACQIQQTPCCRLTFTEWNVFLWTHILDNVLWSQENILYKGYAITKSYESNTMLFIMNQNYGSLQAWPKRTREHQGL